MLTVVNHPLIKVKLALMRDEKTKSKEFRENLDEIASLMCYKVFEDLETHQVEETYRTPTGVDLHKEKLNNKIILAPILRAGIGMVDGVRNMIPTARIGHIGMYRDEETLEPHEYFCKLPKPIEERVILVVDPMLATGGSGSDAIKLVKEKGGRKIKFLALVSCPQGIERLHKDHPDVQIYIGTVDEKLNEKGYIVPGLGDAGDRIFGTK